VEVVDFLRVNGVRGNLATPFDWGQYVLWKLHPAVKVSFDGRYETVYPEEVARDNFNFIRGEGRLAEPPRALPDRDGAGRPRPSRRTAHGSGAGVDARPPGPDQPALRPGRPEREGLAASVDRAGHAALGNHSAIAARLDAARRRML
jgi:hypothetical protein